MTMEYFFNRLFEWVAVWALVGLGIWLIVFPGTMEHSAFRSILHSISGAALVVMYLFSGVVRAAALVANGRWEWSRTWGPVARFVGSGVGAAVWIQMIIALWGLHIEHGKPPSPGIPVYLAITFGELFSACRAAADGNRRRVR